MQVDRISPGEIDQGGVRPAVAEETGEHLAQFADRGRSTPGRRGLRPRRVEFAHELPGLQLFQLARPAEQRTPDEPADVHQHRPEQGMGQMIDTVHPEQGIGFEELYGEGTLVDEFDGQPAGPREGRQNQGVKPDEGAEDKTGHRPGLGAALPENAAQQGRGELCGGGEGHQADGHQGIGFADQPHVGIGQDQHEQDGAAPDEQKKRRQVTREPQLKPFQAQQHRHHQIVTEHGRERDGRDDQHPRGRR